jgi:hypothetical protein
MLLFVSPRPHFRWLPGMQCRQLATSSARMATRLPVKLAMSRLRLVPQHPAGVEQGHMRPSRTPQSALLQPVFQRPDSCIQAACCSQCVDMQIAQLDRQSPPAPLLLMVDNTSPDLPSRAAGA